MNRELDAVLHADVVLSFVRADGLTVSLHRGDGYYVAVWMPGNKLARPVDFGMTGEIPATFFLRRCAEPVTLSAELVAAIRALVNGMRGVKPVERKMFEQALEDGHATLLAREIDSLTTRKGGEGAAALAKRIKAERDSAEAALPESLRTELAQLVAAHRAKRGGRS